MTDVPDWQENVVGPGGVPIAEAILFDWPPDQGFYGWSAPPEYMPAQVELTGGVVIAQFAKAAVSGTVGNLYMYFISPPSDIKANENYLGLYIPVLVGGVTTSLSLLASTAAGAADSPILGTGIIKVPLSPGVAVTAGDIYYIAALFNTASALPIVFYRNNNQQPWTGLKYPYSLSTSTHYTTLPSTIPLSGTNINTQISWAAYGA